MAEMKPSTQNRNLSLLAQLLAGPFLIACQWLSGAASTPERANDGDQPVASVTPVVEQNPSVTEPPTSEADPLDHLLAMRSVTKPRTGRDATAIAEEACHG
jgi:hypothetical protein